MNERIKELAEQATRTIEVKHEGYGGKGYTEQVEFFDKEKFAELIIRECANITLDYKNHDHYMGWVDHGEEIARHFGVER